MINAAAAARDKPWHRPGAVRYALSRLRSLAIPQTKVYEPPHGTQVIDRDVAVSVRDGTVLRVNLYRPPREGRFPVVLSAHPYGKDRLPVKSLFGHKVSIQYRMLRQTDQVRFSTLTGWEAPDPVWWTERGYAVVNCDLRGAGNSGGRGSLISDQEGEDVYDLIEGPVPNRGAPAPLVCWGFRTWPSRNGRWRRCVRRV